MNFLDAAFEVLRSEAKPLHYVDITNLALQRKLLNTKGQTPEASMGSRLYTDTKKPDSRFRRAGKNIFALKETSAADGIELQIEKINRKTRSELRKRLMAMPPDRFEILVAQLLEAIGFQEDTVEISSYGRDGGIDVRGVMKAGGVTEVNAAVQVKRWKKNVQAPVVQNLRGSLTVHEQGILVTTSDFSPGARREAAAQGKARISLVNGDELIELLFQQRIGVIPQRHVVFSLDGEVWAGLYDEMEMPPSGHAEDSSPDVPDFVLEYPVALRASARDQELEAELMDASGQVQFNGEVYRSPSGAGMAAANWKSCNGWSFWKYFNSQTGRWEPIEALRKKSS